MKKLIAMILTVGLSRRSRGRLRGGPRRLLRPRGYYGHGGYYGAGRFFVGLLGGHPRERPLALLRAGVRSRAARLLRASPEQSGCRVIMKRGMSGSGSRAL